MENSIKKTNTQLLKEIQEVSESIDKYKNEVETLLEVIDSLEKEYYEKVEEVKKNNRK